MDEGWAGEPEDGTSKRSEFIPLAYNNDGEVIDVMGYSRKVEAIPYALDNVYIENSIDSRAFDIAEAVLKHFNEKIQDELKESFEMDLEGKVGFISGLSTNIDGQGEGVWIPVQLYRVGD